MDEKQLVYSIENDTITFSNVIQPPVNTEICIGHYDNGTKYLIRLRGDGKIFIRDEEVDDNKEVYRVLREFLGV